MRIALILTLPKRKQIKEQRMIGKSKENTTWKLSGLMTLVLIAVFSAPANAQTAPNGRWEFAVTSGDTQYQLDQAGQVTFSTYLALSGTVLTGNSQQTTNTSAAELYCCNDMVTGTFTKHGSTQTAVIQFAIPANSSTGQAAFGYTFTGTYNPNPSNSGGPTITGTYTTNVNPAFSNGSGTFVATWFPDFPSTPQLYMGGLTGPDEGSGPTDVPTMITLGANKTTHILIGTVSIAGAPHDGTLGIPGLSNNGLSCFVGPLTIQTVTNPALMGVGGAPNGIGVPFASGVGISIYAQDSAGTQLSLVGFAVKPNGNSAAVGESYLTATDDDGDTTTANNGTNNELVLYYGITGGPCDGFGGGDAPFHPVVKHDRHDKPEHHRGDRRNSR
jgi:hypothetical protein